MPIQFRFKKKVRATWLRFGRRFGSVLIISKPFGAVKGLMNQAVASVCGIACAHDADNCGICLTQVVPVHEHLSDLDHPAPDAAAHNGEHEEERLVKRQDEHLTAGKAAFWDVVELYKRMCRAIVPLLLCNLLYYAMWSYCVPNLFCQDAIRNARVRMDAVVLFPLPVHIGPASGLAHRGDPIAVMNDTGHELQLHRLRLRDQWRLQNAPAADSPFSDILHRPVDLADRGAILVWCRPVWRPQLCVVRMGADDSGQPGGGTHHGGRHNVPALGNQQAHSAALPSR